MTETQTSTNSGSVLDDLGEEDGVRKLIECPICLEIPLPPIYLCAKGHIVCNSCQAKTYHCPLCRERYCNTRSFVAEGIVEKCLLRCRFSENGCNVTLKGSELVEHLKICDYRPVICKDCGDKAINFAEYETHLFKEHKISGTSTEEAYVAYRINLNFMNRNIGLNLDTCFWPQYYIKAFDRVFLLRLNAHQYTLNPWICLLGPQSDCEKYIALIEYEPSNDPNTVHSWRGTVNHFRDEAADVICKGRALTVSMDTIMECGAVSSQRAEWIYRILITEKHMSLDPSHEDLRVPSAKTATISGSSSRGVSTAPEIVSETRRAETISDTVATATVPITEVETPASSVIAQAPTSGQQIAVELDSEELIRIAEFANDGTPNMLLSRLTLSSAVAPEEVATAQVFLQQLPTKWAASSLSQLSRDISANIGSVSSAGGEGDEIEIEDSSDWDLY